MGQTVGGILGKAVDWTISACGFPGGSYAGGAVASIIGAITIETFFDFEKCECKCNSGDWCKDKINSNLEEQLKEARKQAKEDGEDIIKEIKLEIDSEEEKEEKEAAEEGEDDERDSDDSDIEDVVAVVRGLGPNGLAMLQQGASISQVLSAAPQSVVNVQEVLPSVGSPSRSASPSRNLRSPSSSLMSR